MPSLMYTIGINKFFTADANYYVNVTIKESNVPQNIANTNLGKSYKIIFSIKAISKVDKAILILHENNIKSLNRPYKSDFYKQALDIGNVSGKILQGSSVFVEGFKRVNLYSAAKPGSTTLIIFEQKIFGQRILYQPLIEMNALKAGAIGKNLKIAGKVVGGLGIGLAIYDIKNNGFTMSNSLDITMSCLAVSGFGSGVAGTYFLINGACVIFTHKDIGQHVDALIN